MRRPNRCMVYLAAPKVHLHVYAALRLHNVYQSLLKHEKGRTFGNDVDSVLTDIP